MIKYTYLIYLKVVFITALLLTILIKISIGQKLEFRFHNNFEEANQTVTALSPFISGVFQNDLLDELTCAQQPAYHFDIHHGIQFDNTLANNFINQSYSIELYFKFDNTSGYRKIINFKNPVNDSGIYCSGSYLDFYPALQLSTTAFYQNQYVHLTVTRDSSTEEVTLYVDGYHKGSFIDSTGLAVLDSANLLNFFIDDNLYEESSGNIALLRLYNYVLSGSEVTASFNSLSMDLSPVTFSTNQINQCFASNDFEFNNTFQDDTSAFTFLWQFGDGFNSSTFNESHSYAAPGNYPVALIATSATCTDSSSVIITVYPDPQINIGNDTTICSGNSVLLNAGNGFSNYIWSDNSGNQFLPVTTSGTYYVQVTDNNGCMNTDTISVIVNPLPIVNLGNDTSFCNGNILVLDAGTGFNIYLWNNGSTLQNIPVNTSGTYSLQVTDSNGCMNNDFITITVNPLPPAPVIIQQGDSLMSNAADGNQWYNMNGIISGATSQYFHPSASGYYFVINTNSFGCLSDSSNIIYYSPLGIKKINKNSFSIAPNPAADFIYIHLPARTANVRISISNILGVTLLEKIYFNDTENIAFNVSQMIPGIYMVSIHSTTGVFTQKLIVTNNNTTIR